MNRKYQRKRRAVNTSSVKIRKRGRCRLKESSGKLKNMMVWESVKNINCIDTRKQKRRLSSSETEAAIKVIESGNLKIYDIQPENLPLQTILERIDKTSKKVARRSWYILNASGTEREKNTIN